MVRGVDHDRIVAQAGAVQTFHQPSDFDVHAFDVGVIARGVLLHVAPASSDTARHGLYRVRAQVETAAAVLAHQLGRSVVEGRMRGIQRQHQHPRAVLVALDEADGVVRHQSRVVPGGHLLPASGLVVRVGAVEVRVGVVPCPPLRKPVARLALRLERVPFRPARVQVPLPDISGVVAGVAEGLSEAVFGPPQRIRVVDDAGLVRPASGHENAPVGRANGIVRNAMGKRRALRCEAGQGGGLGIVVRLARHRASPVLVAEYEQHVGLARLLRAGRGSARHGQGLQHVSARGVRYHDAGILAAHPARRCRAAPARSTVPRQQIS